VKNQKSKPVSELRRDLVSGAWIVIATGRAKKPSEFVKAGKKIKSSPIKTCPFENPQKTSHSAPLLTLFKTKKEKDWWVQVVPNKFPAFGPAGTCEEVRETGPYSVMDGVGFHEVVITRDHHRHWALFSQKEAELVVRAYQERYLGLMKDKCVRYIAIFHNHGIAAGASIYHPHSQIVAIPVIDPDVSRSLLGSANYHHENQKCVHCVMVNFERDEKIRLIYENQFFVAFCPFASRAAFEVRIFPKIHEPCFEQIDEDQRIYFAEALRVSLRKIYKGLKNPAYNFFIHTAPVTSRPAKDYYHYHWHLEILPKTSTWAGFELGAGIEISTIEPEKAAEYLRKF
ncbi:MAG: DUF4921 family protein, partial [bacterium]|nr:DUF4921 family protein [bacterium]